MELKTIKSFSDTFDANIVKARLESEGIECYLEHESVVNIAWMSSDAIGGLKLKVNENDYERAMNIINSGIDFNEADEFVQDEDVETHNGKRCPVCNSQAIIETVYPKVLSFFFSLFGFVSEKSYIKKDNCSNCGNKWKE